jgi:hypothetical protein
MGNNKIIKQVLLFSIFICMFVAFFPVVEVKSFEYEDVTLDINTLFQFQNDAVKKAF